ncbi:hypothetical protein AALO_G00112660 [Alosa alosa]|uniref:Uncharacterized protein n=1 Tax=Alosa alosa TaxID=278164 RepID=A0AAV6GTX6_9TELE|nr:hypothetical protein AALO_G00112660 [Alosa alosa]
MLSSFYKSIQDLCTRKQGTGGYVCTSNVIFILQIYTRLVYQKTRHRWLCLHKQCYLHFYKSIQDLCTRKQGTGGHVCTSNEIIKCRDVFVHFYKCTGIAKCRDVFVHFYKCTGIAKCRDVFVHFY